MVVKRFFLKGKNQNAQKITTENTKTWGSQVVDLLEKQCLWPHSRSQFQAAVNRMEPGKVYCRNKGARCVCVCVCV